MHNLEWALTVNTECCIRITFCFSNCRCPHQLAHDGGQSKALRSSHLSFRRAQGSYVSLTVQSQHFNLCLFLPYVSVLLCYSHAGLFLVFLSKSSGPFPVETGSWVSVPVLRSLPPTLYVTSGCVKTFPATTLLMGESLSSYCLQSLVSWSCLQSPNTSCPTLSSFFLSICPHSSSFYSPQELYLSLDWEPSPDHTHVCP